ncbi:hypothetical protein EB118_19865 [bacterium]|nr:hypothetical protein [bacterium]NDD83976.1 hypothetical protein [bacterium]NDG32320.1 hypothetical protein [bacterium]
MSDYVVLCGVVFVVFCAMIYGVYYGVYGSLSSARIGEVYNFYYLQPLTGEYERYLAKVIAKRDMREDIHRLNRNSNYRLGDLAFKRSNTLVTCELSNGEIRNFYAERVKDCYRSIFGRLLYSTGMACMF